MKESGQLIMIADQDPYVRDMVSRFISDAGYRVTVAAQGYEALDDARKLLPAAIMADIMLPKLDGLTLCRLLKSDPATERIITVIVFSVLSAEERARKAGADGFILKPLEKSRVLNVLEQAIVKGPQNG
ncbi:MAG: response regulator [Cyanobacteria bacterium REEB67]|nr:response regulator [Cyanobacteria bacterium REEB67]